jgi:hypothetical protein
VIEGEKVISGKELQLKEDASLVVVAEEQRFKCKLAGL